MNKQIHEMFMSFMSYIFAHHAHKAMNLWEEETAHEILNYSRNLVFNLIYTIFS